MTSKKSWFKGHHCSQRWPQKFCEHNGSGTIEKISTKSYKNISYTVGPDHWFKGQGHRNTFEKCINFIKRSTAAALEPINGGDTMT